jgi:hypothetical protein
VTALPQERNVLNTGPPTSGLNFFFFAVLSSLLFVTNITTVVFFLLGDSPASEFYVPTFRNTLFHLHRWCKLEEYPSNLVPVFLLFTSLMNMEQTECSETSAHKIQTPVNHPIERIQHSEHGDYDCHQIFYTEIVIRNIRFCQFKFRLVDGCRDGKFYRFFLVL